MKISGEKLVKVFDEMSRLDSISPEMADEIESELKGKIEDKAEYLNTKTLEETLKILRGNFSDNNGVLLFSPGFPSFDQFQNYAERGKHFVKLLTN